MALSTEYWMSSWKAGDIVFHNDFIYPMLQKHAEKLFDNQSNCRVFVPLCGKSLDMKWFADLGHSVVGVDVSEVGILSFFEDQGIEYVKESVPEIQGATRYKSKDGKITIYKANLFSMKKDIIGDFDCIWDNGSLVAINKQDRQKYVSTLTSLMADSCRYLLIALDFDPIKSEPTCTLEKLDASSYRVHGREAVYYETVFLMKPK
ncbi:thiopurine S-methyltransferase-like isoform X2 [Antedon mediterranea]|uniref:thiopurine S-methyltransferase-like isoform X2 n=1 Tax=Antedon mediterranea TaxID=105859 RepID=UPI003AF92616